MNDRELSIFLTQQNTYLKKQLDDQCVFISTLTTAVNSLTSEVSELKKLLMQKDAHTQSMVSKLNNLTKITFPKKNESRKKEVSLSEVQQPVPTPKERGNNGAKRKVYDIEEVVEQVEPNHPGFVKENSVFLFYRDVIRYKYIPPRVIKHIYRCNSYRMGDDIYQGATPVSPFLNSNYDSSIIANLLQQRFVYGLPVERIVKYYHEMGIDIPKPTAHGLITKAGEALDRLNPILKDAVLSESYIHFDETYHTIIDKDTDKGSRKSYFWAALANRSKLIHFFYENGSRSKTVFLNYLPCTYSGAVQSDGYSSYKSLDGWEYPKAIRLGCIQHCKRKFFDIENQKEASQIIALYNKFYQIRHRSPKELWVEQSRVVFEQLKQQLMEIERNGKYYSNSILLKGVAYCLNELDSIRNIIMATDYDLDNNQIERPMRYISCSRKNSLFCGSRKAAQRMATIYSLAISCRLNNINTFEYFKDVINRLATIHINDSSDLLRPLLPDVWAEIN